MYMMYMAKVRKQLYIEERQEQLLRERAEALGVSEAEIVRAALDVALRPRKRARRDDAIDRFVDGVERDVRAGHAWSTGPFRRDQAYEDRGSRGR
jgi:hypothetical protein